MANLKRICINEDCVDVVNELNDSGNVDITNPADGDVLKYDAQSGKWINASQ